MYEHVSYRQEDARKILTELTNDTSPWFYPKGKVGGVPGQGDFDYGRMRYVNRNLNYFYFNNMVSHALRNNYEFNMHYPNTLDFCESIREVIGETGPFGRMCLWRLVPKGFLLPHYDRWEYHRHIQRYILCVSDHEKDDATIRIGGQEIAVTQGLLFSFNPAIEMHEFINHTDRDWNFFGFDYWIPEKLEEAKNTTGITSDTVIEYTDGFGIKQQKYMSKE